MTMSTVELSAPNARATARPAAVLHEPLRVMHLLLKFGFGGSEGGVLKLANGFDRSQIQPSICSCLPADAIKRKLAPDVRLFEMNRRSGNDLGFVARLWQLLRRERPHVLHTHGWATLCEGVLAGRLASVPVIVHGEHGTLETRQRNLLLQRLVWGRADQVLSVSSRLAEKMAATVRFPLERIQTIPNGVDLIRFKPDRRAAGRRALGVDSRDLVIGTVGRLLPVKDHRAFISALDGLKGRGQSFKAIIVGDGPLRQELGDYVATRDLQQAVMFLGNRVDIETVLAGFDIFVSSSISEGLSNTILEAMASGLAVVATDVGGTSELVVNESTGFLVPPGDPAALTDAMLTLVKDDGQRRAMGAAGRVRAEAEFDVSGMIEKYAQLYVDLFCGRDSVATRAAWRAT